MPLSKPLIGELRTIFCEEYGVDIGEAEAVEIGQNLVHYFSLLAQIAYREEQQPPERPP